MKQRIAHIVVVLLSLPALAAAQQSCLHARPQQLALDLDGVETLALEIGRHTLRLDGAENADAVLRGRACASSEKRLESLRLSQEREGTRLIVRAEDDSHGNTFRLFGGSDYGYHDLSLRIPPTLAVELSLGSGDAFAHDLATLDARVGSGDLEIGRIAGPVRLVVGSGDVKLESVGPLHVSGIGSGDLVARAVGGDLSIDALGSGDATVREIAGDARIGAVGSGDLALHQVAGKVEIERIGSGDVVLRGVGGEVTVGRLGSGDLSVVDVEGGVRVEQKGHGDVRHRNVKGEVVVVLKPR